ncbi:MAG: hypothetical protein ACE5IL_03280 [Myxococcota bacterium]
MRTLRLRIGSGGWAILLVGCLLPAVSAATSPGEPRHEVRVGLERTIGAAIALEPGFLERAGSGDPSTRSATPRRIPERVRALYPRGSTPSERSFPVAPRGRPSPGSR